MGIFDRFKTTSSFQFVNEITTREGITFTSEEHQFVEYGLQQLNKDYEVTEGTEWVQRALIGKMLSSCIEQKVTKATLEDNQEKSVQLLREAFATLVKARTIYPIPILGYDMALLAESIDPTTSTTELYEEFLRLQKDFQPEPIDEEFMRQRDMLGAIQDAERKVQIDSFDKDDLKGICKLQSIQLVNLTAYVVYLLLSDEIREDHKTKFLDYIEQTRPQANDASELSSLAFNAIENISQQLASSGSTLNAHAMIWNAKKE